MSSCAGVRRIGALVAALGICCGQPPAALAQANLSFEEIASDGRAAAWQGDRGVVAVDSAVALDGSRSLRLEPPETDGLARVTQRFPMPAVTGNRLRIRAYVRTRSGDTDVGLWVRIDAADGLLYVDGAGATRQAPADSLAGAALPGDRHGWALYELQAPVFAEAESLTIGASVRGRGAAWFDLFAVDGVSTTTRPAARPPAAAYLDTALDILEKHAWRAGTLDWPQLRADAHAQARGAQQPADAHLALRYALSRLGDRHSYLMPPERVRTLEHTAVSNARTGRAAAAPRAESLAHGVGYLWLPGFAGGTHAAQVEFAQRAQDLIAALDAEPRCGWLLDLRENNGGNLWPMLVGIGPLLGDAQAGAVVYRDGRSEPYWYAEGRAGLGEYVQLRVPQAYQLHWPDSPVAVLIGEETASSAETLLLAFAGRFQSRSFGTATRGLTTVNRTFPLSDGSALVLAVAGSRDPLGRMRVGPLPPDQPIAAHDVDAPLSEQPAVQAALDWLAGQALGCRVGQV